MTNLLEVHDLHTRYGRVEALSGVSISVPQGHIVSVIGANGAGKTTLMNSVMGVLPSQGQIRYNGHDIHHMSLEGRVQEGICLVPERRDLFASMTVADNLMLGAYSRRSKPWKADLEDVYRRFPRLLERRMQLAGTLSGGEQQMLAIARALLSRPKLLLLDEPSLGLAPKMTAAVFELVSGLRDAGLSVLLVEQKARHTLKVADRAYLLELGRVVTSGRAADLANDPVISETFLGGHPLVAAAPQP